MDGDEGTEATTCPVCLTVESGAVETHRAQSPIDSPRGHDHGALETLLTYAPTSRLRIFLSCTLRSCSVTLMYTLMRCIVELQTATTASSSSRSTSNTPVRCCIFESRTTSLYMNLTCI